MRLNFKSVFNDGDPLFRGIPSLINFFRVHLSLSRALSRSLSLSLSLTLFPPRALFLSAPLAAARPLIFDSLPFPFSFDSIRARTIDYSCSINHELPTSTRALFAPAVRILPNSPRIFRPPESTDPDRARESVFVNPRRLERSGSPELRTRSRFYASPRFGPCFAVGATE